MAAPSDPVPRDPVPGDAVLSDSDRLRAAAQAWSDADPDPATSEEVRSLLAAGDDAALAERFGVRLTFGTAGIRGALGAGPGRMNRVLVRQVTAGLAARLQAEGEDAVRRGVVVGRDARHKSDVFADDTARVLAGAGFRVHRFAGPVPTPLVAFAVRHLGAAAGVQVTASHNPAADNGYKVYWDGGAQIAEPLDTQIADAIAAAGPPGTVALAPADDERIVGVPDAVRAAYVAACTGLQLHPGARDLRIAYTPLHGVAGDLCLEALAAGGFTDVHVPAAQADPDPDFPTVAFPNPEEPGALDLVLALAEARGADLVLANDPDGDRIAAAIPDPAGGWRALTGDEVGCLLAEYHLADGGGGPERVVATTVVSSQLLARIAAHHGVGYAETLTGFKWLARAAAEAEASGGRMVVAYEQALGAMVGTAVRDKDGISAALALAELAQVCKTAGRGLQDVLDDLARRHGVHATAGRSIRLTGADGPALVAAILDRLRDEPPTAVGGVEVVAWEDRAARLRRHRDGSQDALATPATPLLGFLLADGSRLQVRPSGTEPLLKFYVEVVEAVVDGEQVAAARRRAAERLAAMADAFLTLAR
jgi:phosphomannomutase